MRNFSIISLGCPKNLTDSENFFSIFKQAGYNFTDNVNIAEILLINTCGFIRDAQEESINTILEHILLKNNKLKKLIVTGCLVKRFQEELKQEIPEVDLWLDLKDFDGLQKLLNTHFKIEREILTLPHYAYLRVSDGCNNRCSYCAIPDIRGELHSISIENLLEEAKILALKGVKELIVNAQDTSNYGKDLHGKSMLVELLTKLDNLKLFKWIRLLYLHPAHLTKEMVFEFSKIKSLLPYFDIPLQHINDNILKNMNRKITKQETLSLLNFIRETIPQAAIRTTFITGFPGETKKDYIELKNFIQEFRFTRLGVFSYSQEKGTPAYNFNNQVNKQTAQNRKDRLMAIQQKISEEIMSSFIDQELEVIIDRKANEESFLYEGRSYLDAPEIDGTIFITHGNAKPGDIVTVQITDSWEYDLVGKIINNVTNT
ncbi:MAG: 30S ribosomal protein S12 methylthiotransferase RimO [Candidatus Cloacimonetes bacterium]|jgi:ribosomal protein S12 methylthiotransferase|nr:30S ribosomal protein S12 methylthiotransferase RimO [Candidatus Cloacimonadota bacterium]MDD4155218.1 30S ribosomal protein S12 methylthiotransferase RimO [Candidatus Cloacimonadota bacterium]